MMVMNSVNMDMGPSGMLDGLDNVHVGVSMRGHAPLARKQYGNQ